MKLNVLLAKTDYLASFFKKSLEDYIKFFKDKQGSFKGHQKVYEPRVGTQDSPGDRGVVVVTTTVDEKLKWLEEGSSEYLDALFTQEKTNAEGSAHAELRVEGKSLGNYTSLELLRLKSTLENRSLVDMYENIPVRSDDQQWEGADAEMYKGRDGIFQSRKLTGIKKTIVKEALILADPNIEKVKSGTYTPQLGSKDTVVELGEYSVQVFSGEWSHRQRAELLRRRTILLGAVIEALKIANEAESLPSKLSSRVLFDYLHRGTLPSVSK